MHRAEGHSRTHLTPGQRPDGSGQVVIPHDPFYSTLDVAVVHHQTPRQPVHIWCVCVSSHMVTHQHRQPHGIHALQFCRCRPGLFPRQHGRCCIRRQARAPCQGLDHSRHHCHSCPIRQRDRPGRAAVSLAQQPPHQGDKLLLGLGKAGRDLTTPVAQNVPQSFCHSSGPQFCRRVCVRIDLHRACVISQIVVFQQRPHLPGADQGDEGHLEHHAQHSRMVAHAHCSVDCAEPFLVDPEVPVLLLHYLDARAHATQRRNLCVQDGVVLVLGVEGVEWYQVQDRLRMCHAHLIQALRDVPDNPLVVSVAPPRIDRSAQEDADPSGGDNKRQTYSPRHGERVRHVWEARDVPVPDARLHSRLVGPRPEDDVIEEIDIVYAGLEGHTDAQGDLRTFERLQLRG